MARRSSSPPAALRDREFEQIRSWARRSLGIHLAETKRPLVVARLGPRLRALGLSTFEEYFARALDDEREHARLVDRLTTHETAFFREPRQFEHLEQRVFPAWRAAAATGRRPKTIRAWSAACSTGEEPFSLAMSLAHNFPEIEGWQIEIVASDVSTTALDRARAATWPLGRAKEIPERHRKTFMLRGSGPQEGRMRASPELRRLVRFDVQNLQDARWSIGGPFDLVLCRNVLIYFTTETREAVMDRLVRVLAPNGVLLLGHAESMRGRSGVRAAIPNVYVRSSGDDDGER